MSLNSDFLREAQGRGFIHQCTDLAALDNKMSEGQITAYAGFDPTAISLHVGHMVPIMMLRLLQRTGHSPLVIMGGATARIGDPSFKNEMRKMLSDDEIASNIKSIESSFERFVDFRVVSNAAKILDNATWLNRLAYLDFLRDFGCHITVNRLLTFDTIKTRLDKQLPLSFLEFNYMLFQAYDYYYLNKELGCILQIGGSDQWANIINGVEFVRKVSKKESFGLTTPLLTTASGAKMGKTEKGAIWLNPDLLSDYDFWQFWRNTHDDDVIKFLKLFTDLSLNEISKFSDLKGQDLNEIKKLLADEVTKIVRGEGALTSIHETTVKLFEKEDQVAYEISGQDDQGNPILETSLPVVDVVRDGASKLLAFECVVLSGLSSSNGEARRLIRGKGVRLQNITISDENAVIELPEEAVIKVSVGKKKNALIRIIN